MPALRILTADECRAAPEWTGLRSIPLSGRPRTAVAISHVPERQSIPSDESRARTAWSERENAILRELHDLGAPARQIAAHLPGRTSGAAERQADKLGLRWGATREPLPDHAVKAALRWVAERAR